MRRVLVVDNDACVLQVAKTILKRSGFTILGADNGSEALAILQTHDVDILLTAIVMPGMSGTELIIEARKRKPNLSVCCMTAYFPLVDHDLDLLPVIPKPFAPRQLINAVRHILEGQPDRRDQVGASSSASLPTTPNPRSTDIMR